VLLKLKDVIIDNIYCSGYVRIYYDVLTDLFAIVDSKSNKLLDFSVADIIDYVDIFRYKSVF
jgi:hypothetical protein